MYNIAKKNFYLSVCLIAFLGLLPFKVSAQFSPDESNYTIDFFKNSVLSHTVVNGDTLYNISKKYCISRTSIRGSNTALRRPLTIGQVLTIPLEEGHCYSSPEEKIEPEESNNNKNNIKTTARYTEPISNDGHSIGNQLAPTRSNELSSNKYERGQQSPNTVLVSDVSHLVARGDTLYWIARKYCSPISELQRVNNITDHSAIKPGVSLYIPVDNCIEGSSSVNKPVQSETKYTDEEKRVIQAAKAEKAKRPKNFVGIETFNPIEGELDCYRTSATDTGDNGLTAEECFAEKERIRSEQAAEAKAARDARRAAKLPHVEAPSGFAAFLANKDVQRALIDGGNAHYQGEAERARTRQKIANDAIQRQRERDFQIERNRQQQIRQAERVQSQRESQQEIALSSTRTQQSADNGDVKTTRNSDINYQGRNSSESSSNSKNVSVANDKGCYKISRICISIDIEKVGSKTSLWVTNDCSTRMYRRTCLYDRSNKDFCEAGWLPANSKKLHYSYNEDITSKYKVEVVGSNKGANDWVCSTNDELVETFR